MANAVHEAVQLAEVKLCREQLGLSRIRGRVYEVGAAVGEDLAEQGDEAHSCEHVGVNVHRKDHMVLKEHPYGRGAEHLLARCYSVIGRNVKTARIDRRRAERKIRRCGYGCAQGFQHGLRQPRK